MKAQVNAVKRSANAPPASRDPGNCTLAFKKIPKGVFAEDRLKVINDWMLDNFSGIRVRDVVNVYCGPFPNGRTLTPMTLVELSSSDVRREVLEKIKVRKLSISLGGVELEVKKGLSENAIARNATLRKAADLLKKDARCASKAVKIVYDGYRGVTVDGVLAFDQPKGQELGGFVEPYLDFLLP